MSAAKKNTASPADQQLIQAYDVYYIQWASCLRATSWKQQFCGLQHTSNALQTDLGLFFLIDYVLHTL